MAEEGAKVVVNDIGRDADGKSLADIVVDEIKKAGGTAIANYDSVATMSGGQSIINAAVSSFGKIDILVNTAGNYLVGGILDMKESDWDAVIAVHLKGLFSCTQAAAREMVKQKSGRIINISSPTPFSHRPPGSRSIAYSAAKSGVVGFTITSAVHLAEHGITVNGMIPGAITKLFPEQAFDRAGGAASYRRRGGPEFVAPTIVYLCTDAAKDITGRFFYASGGGVSVYNRPFQLMGSNSVVYKMGQWTIDELKEVIPPML
jgi:NAD(P)-dependent dehydrogenase (short-subunit alcohol dehydrogenase family)